jgi:three-Cys-motif partner protein
MITLSDYAGREQSYVKHFFLENYLEQLVFKTAGVYPCIAYVDGYAGPWQSINENFKDTSFGIALRALDRAKASWKPRGRNVRMMAFLVEPNKEAYKKLVEVPSRYPDLTVRTYPAKFVSVLPDILRDIPDEAFGFFLIDPMGWRIRLSELQPMLARSRSEVVFTFMFDFINRAVGMSGAVATALNELMPYGNWREALRTAQDAETRKAILVDAFASNLKHFGEYSYVAEQTVLRKVKDRALYCLFYATRSPVGIAAFRDCQVKALKEQSKTRAATKISYESSKTGQSEIFKSYHEMAPDNDLTAFFESERSAAGDTLLDLTPKQPDGIRYERLWPQVLARHVVRRTDVGRIAAQFRKEGKLLFPGWESGKQVPQPGYQVQRPD